MLQAPSRKNVHDRMVQLNRCAVKRTRRPEIVNVLAVAPGNSALARFHNRQQRDLVGTPVKHYPALATVLRAQDPGSH